MAIITQTLLPGEYVWGKGKALVFTRLVKTDIVRQGITGWTKTVQKVRIPSDPQTQPQLGVRALVQFISNRWWAMTPTQRAVWKAYAETYPMKVTAYYLWQLMLRWMAFQTPAADWPAAEASDPIAISAHQYTGGKRFATLSLTPADDTALYGMIILRSQLEILTPSHLDTIAMIPKTTSSALLYTDSPLRPATYHYRAACFNTDGVLGPVLADDTVTVT